MKKQIQIADAELPIMKVLWDKGDLTSPEIFADMDGNKSTLKTLLQRLVAKGAVKATEVNSRTYRYSPIITREEYTNATRKSFIQKVFDGSSEKMLLNFVKEEKISREDLQRLLDIIEEE
ncbi:MAG TPA: BlaI/MecI/CopY family transcriptional regulator [Clostridiales bacterium]|nr:BlaI/MecI/CopY family transcriptional regulator [Clostridiales bacterium]